jgi:hypothetical protein
MLVQNEIILVVEELLTKYCPQARGLRERSRTLGLDAGHLSRILSGKRQLCIDTASALLVAMNADDSDSTRLLCLAARSEAEKMISKIQSRILRKSVFRSAIRDYVIQSIETNIKSSQS